MESKRSTQTSDTGTPYVPAKLCEYPTKWCIEWWWYSYKADKLLQKRLYTIPGATPAERRRNAAGIVRQINRELHAGATADPAPQAAEPQQQRFLEALRMACTVRGQAASKRMMQSFTSFLNVFTEWYTGARLEQTLVREFSKAHVYAYMDWLKSERGVTNVTRNNHLRLLRMGLKELEQRGILEGSPARGVRRLKEQGRKNVPYTATQQLRLEEWLRQQDQRLYWFTRFIYHAFLRPVEITRLQARDVDILRGVILVRAQQSKSARQEAIIITRGLTRVLDEMNFAGIDPGAYIFSDDLRPGYKLLHRARVTERYHAALRACEIEDKELTLYNWKHTGTIAAYRSGVDMLSIMRQCRHKDPKQTMQYMQSIGLMLEFDLKDAEW